MRQSRINPLLRGAQRVMTPISIGILAHNEAGAIGATLESLLEQSLLSRDPGDYRVEIVVVPNGCSDNTIAVAAATLERRAAEREPISLSCKICALHHAGK